jgi:hypothetical protein
MLKKLLFAVALTLTPVSIACAGNPEIIDGTCSPDSHTAEGPIDSDLTKRQSRFFCDSAVIVSYNDYKGHLLVQFLEKEAHHPQIIGFAGRLFAGPLDNETVMKVEHAYLGGGGGKPITVSDGYCRFYSKDQAISGIVCGMKVDETGRRTVAIVSFDARSASK